MTSDGERLATVEAGLAELRSDIAALSSQMDRTRTRLHNLEGFAQAYLDLQRANRRQEKAENEKLATRISLGSLLMAGAMVVLAIVTIFLHTH